MIQVSLLLPKGVGWCLQQHTFLHLFLIVKATQSKPVTLLHCSQLSLCGLVISFPFSIQNQRMLGLLSSKSTNGIFLLWGWVQSTTGRYLHLPTQPPTRHHEITVHLASRWPPAFSSYLEKYLIRTVLPSCWELPRQRKGAFCDVDLWQHWSITFPMHGARCSLSGGHGTSATGWRPSSLDLGSVGKVCLLLSIISFP